MFGQHLWTINIIYIAFGIIIVAYAAIILADNVRPQSGAFYVYNPLGHSQPNKLRKLYWYSMGQPILTPRKQRMASFQMKQRYQNIPIKITSTFTNPVRNTYRNAYDASISASALKSYMNSVSLPTTALPKNSPRFQPSNPYDEPTYEDNKSCVEKNITMAAQHSGITVAQHLRPVQITSVPYNIPPITPLPIVPYVSHTYFTLDDVVIPSSSENLLYYKPEEKQIIPEVTPPPLTTQRSKSAESPLIDIFNIFGIEPEEKPIEEKPQELVRDSEITTTSWMPVTMNIIKNETKMDIKPFKPMSLSQTMVENVLNIVTNHKNSTLIPEIETVANSSKELCKDCLKDEILTTLSPILNEIEDKKIEKTKEKNPVKKYERHR
ncbi:uncharacterized protein LOC132789519 [Drosophila nasuta]|uniref:uncharacterized protein LOC132789519 n=1 Tax=Drosophila nasuta TaxID=42062 RepID=UPI00295E6BFB|nr:uncharacterized protein LOC132789519 [Drosophila nasuta]